MRFLLILIISLSAISEPRILKKYNVSATKEVKDIIGEDRTWRFGSGLAFRKNSRSLSFYVISSDNDLTANPLIGVLEIKKDKAKIARFTKLSATESFDLEAVSVAEDSKLWLADENYPAILKVDSETGKVEKILSAGSGLPTILNNRKKGRGFEGIAVNTEGKVLIATQSVLDFGQTSNFGFMRLVQYDPKTGETKTYAYLPDADYIQFDEAKIGDLQAISENKYILIEQGQKKEAYVNKIFEIDLTGASDITDAKLNGKELELTTQDEFQKNYKFITKREIVDLNKLGWKYRKAEGLALLNDGITIAVSNDPEDKDEGLKIWTISLDQSLILWTWREWAMIIILPLIFLFSMLVFAKALFLNNSK